MAELSLGKCVVVSLLIGGLAAAMLGLVAQYEPLSEGISTFFYMVGIPFVLLGTRVLPSSVTVPHDPVGHPALWILGIVLTLSLIAFVALVVARSILRKRASC